jgi:cobalt-zinc-cadmium efflux system protein
MRSPADRDERLLAGALGLLLLFLLGEVSAAFVAGSLALLADAAHLLIDVLALAAALVARRLAARPSAGSWTFGLARAETLSALVNGATLAILSAVVAADAIRRLVAPPHVDGTVVVVVASIGLVINIAASLLLRRADRRSLNIRGAIAHVLTDAYGFAATLAAGAVILATGWRRADPVASLVLVGVLAVAAAGLLRESGRILLEAAPPEVDLSQVRSHLLENEHVLDVHDLHVWTPTSRLPALSVHVVVDDDCFESGRAPRLLDRLQTCLTGHFDVEHSTFQLEAAGHVEHEFDAHA